MVDLLRHLTLTHAWFNDGTNTFNYVSWSISAELCAYLIFPMVALGMSARPLVGFALVVLIYGLAIAISVCVIGDELTSLNWKMGALRAIPSFTFGVWLSVNRKLIVGLLPARRAGLVVYASFISLVAAIVCDASAYLDLLLVVALVSAAFACDLQARKTVMGYKLFSRFGYLTYSIYMLHPVVATIFISFLFPRLLGTTLSVKVLSVLVSLPITLALAVFSYRFFEKPTRHYLNGVRLAGRGEACASPEGYAPGAIVAAIAQKRLSD